MDGVNSMQGLNVHTHRDPGADHARSPATATCPTDPMSRRAPSSGSGRRRSRRKSRILERQDRAGTEGHGPWQQVSRLGNPLFNEVIVPMAEKDEWNVRLPGRRQGLREVRQPARAGQAAAGALPGRVPEPGEVHEAAGGPERDPADRHPDGGRARVPELHRPGEGGHAAAQRRHPAVEEPRTRWAWSPATPPASPTAAG